MLKIGVLGAGHLGKIHLQLLKELKDEYQLLGFFDVDAQNAAKVENELGVKAWDDMAQLIDAVDVVDIVTPTTTHYDYASLSLKKGKHLFIEKPLAGTMAEAKKLISLAKEANAKVQVGHVERFNPAFVAAIPLLDQPMFIDIHRSAQFVNRDIDTSVILDLMINDIEIILSSVKSNIRKISASGVCVVSDTYDIANARIEFDNGCVANITSSRISLKNTHKSHFFQKDAHIIVDFLEKKTEIVRMKPVNGQKSSSHKPTTVEKDKGEKQILLEMPDIQATNAVKEELKSLAIAIMEDSNPIVSIDDGYKAMEVAYQIIEKMKLSSHLETQV